MVVDDEDHKAEQMMSHGTAFTAYTPLSLYSSKPVSLISYSYIRQSKKIIDRESRAPYFHLFCQSELHDIISISCYKILAYSSAMRVYKLCTIYSSECVGKIMLHQPQEWHGESRSATENVLVLQVLAFQVLEERHGGYPWVSVNLLPFPG